MCNNGTKDEIYDPVAGSLEGPVFQSSCHQCYTTIVPTCLLTCACRSWWSIGHQRPLAITLISGLLWPFQSSWSLFASVTRLQLLQGRPLFLSPCGLQVRAWRVVLDAGFPRVCPIQPHLLHSICLATGPCPALFYRSSFRIFSCHWIL